MDPLIQVRTSDIGDNLPEEKPDLALLWLTYLGVLHVLGCVEQDIFL